MAALALAAVGSAIGSTAITGTVLGMTGASFGWMVGSMAGSLLFPPKVPDGPRLDDKAVQVSTYGQPMPRLYGTTRLAGNVLWSTELIETEHEQGGKGGPSYTTYSYRASFAVSICQGPVAGIRRIWADGKLILDRSADNTGPQIGYEAASLAMYDGTETQLPDPTMQALQGDVPAYRGQVYVVFTDLQLAKFGNRLPSLTFEVVQSGVFDTPPPVAIGNGNADGDFDPVTGYFWTHNSNQTVYVHDVFEQSQKASFRAVNSSNAVDTIKSICYGVRGGWYMISPDLERAYGEWPRGFWLGIGLSTLMPSGFFSVSQVHGFADAETYKTATGYVRFSGTGDLGGIYIPPGASVNYSYTIGSAVDTGVAASVYLPGKAVYDLGRPESGFYGAGGRWSYVITCGDTGYAAAVHNGIESKWGVSVFKWASGEFAYKTAPSGFLGTHNSGVAFDSARGRLLNTNYAATHAYLIDLVSGSQAMVPCASGLRDVVYSADRDSFFATINNTSIVELDPVTLAVKKSIAMPGVIIRRIYCALESNDFLLATTSDNTLYKVPITDRLTPLTVPLSDVVAAESALAGLQASDLDVTALVPVAVAGFALTAAGSVRSGIEQLMMAYAFDAVESGGVVKFVRRGGAAAVTIDAVDLAAHQPGNDVPAPLPITRAEEVELPQRITVRYINALADYQAGAQSAQRLTGRAMAQQAVDLPIVLTDDQAQQVAESALFSAWTARSTVKFSTTLKHAQLEPTDVVSIGGNTVRITGRIENADLLQFEAAFENGSVYTQVAQGATASTQAQSIFLSGRTGLEFLDVPPLRDQDDDAGIYLAASGYRAAWEGALVYKSIDGGSTFDEFALLTTEAAIGSSVDALADRNENTFDEASSVTVVLRSGTLSSLTELAVLNSGNAALLGREIIQFRNATLNADGSYTLTGLLRGRKGTPTNGHDAGDRFVLLNASSLRRVSAPVSEIGLAREYKAVTIGTTLSSALAVSFSNTGQSVKPLSPVHLGGGRSSGGNVFIGWKRRTRIGGAWRDFADAQLGEDFEGYEVDVFSDATYTTVKRTISSASTSVTYTSSQQTTDFGSVQSKVYLRVYQISATAGRGNALQGSV